MAKTILERKGDVAVLRLDNGVTNALGVDLIREVDAVLDEIKTQYKGMVLCGGEKFFSIGLDLPELLALDRTAMTDFWNRFNQLAFDMFTLPLPTVCVICGHAVAGGAVLALTCDYRYAGAADKQIGLNEIRIGLPPPYLTDLILRQVVGDRHATDMLYTGRFTPLSSAKHIGLIDRIHPAETAEEKAVNAVADIAAFSGEAFAAVKANRVEAVRARYEAHHVFKNEQSMDCWFSEATQRLLQEAASKFSK